jgi:hypothetical protein
MSKKSKRQNGTASPTPTFGGCNARANAIQPDYMMSGAIEAHRHSGGFHHHRSGGAVLLHQLN